MQKKKTTKKTAHNSSHINLEEEVVTRGMLMPMFEDLKDFMRSLVKESETALGKRIDSVDEKLGKRIDAVEGKLGRKVDSVVTELRTTQNAVIDNGRRITALQSEIKESRKTAEKVEKIENRLNAVESKVKTHDQALHNANLV